MVSYVNLLSVVGCGCLVPGLQGGGDGGGVGVVARITTTATTVTGDLRGTGDVRGTSSPGLLGPSSTGLLMMLLFLLLETYGGKGFDLDQMLSFKNYLF